MDGRVIEDLKVIRVLKVRQEPMVLLEIMEHKDHLVLMVHQVLMDHKDSKVDKVLLVLMV